MRFYLSRLRNMAPAEGWQRLKTFYFAVGFARLARRLDRPSAHAVGLALPELRSCGQADRPLSAEEIRASELFGRRNRRKWTKISAADSGGDIRRLWEPARLQDSLLAIVKAGQGPVNSPSDPECGELLAWIAENPLGIGPHYMSAMECGLRVPVFAYALFSCAGLDHRQQAVVAQTIYEHAWFISRRLSLYSSLGNHTVCESVGLVFAGTIFKDDRRGGKWLTRGIALLEQELEHQILPDGGPAEQSFNYLRCVLDLYWLTVDLLESNRLYDCARWKTRLERAEGFLRTVELAPGELPAVGDSDDGRALGPGLCPRRGTGTGRASSPCTVFEQSGYTVLNGPAEARLIFDHGPLGMAPLYNHGHADALSVQLAVRGLPLLVDPGTYRYNGAPQWRRYFKGTRAHNTVTIDGLDQAVYETGFIWSHPWKITGFALAEGDESAVWAEHDGYCRLKQPVSHRRAVRREASGYVITDTFSGAGSHAFELNFHLHPDAQLAERDGVWTVRRAGACCRIGLASEGRLEMRRGETAPIKGWFSPGYDQKLPCPVLSCCRKGSPAGIGFVTRLEIPVQEREA